MPKIFISYRRTDSAYAAHQIRDVLSDQFGAENIVFDVESIPLGMDFRDYINDQIMQCDVLLALMGDDWGKIIQERRDDPKDFVRIEIETALKRDIPVIPVLVERAIMPDESELPDSIAPLAYRNATEVRAGADFRGQLTRLVNALDQLLGKFQQAGTEEAGLEGENHEREKIEQQPLEQERHKEEQAIRESAEQGVQELVNSNERLPGQAIGQEKPGKNKNVFALIGIVGVIVLAVSSYLIYSFSGSTLTTNNTKVAVSKETVLAGEKLLSRLDKTKNNSPESGTIFDPFPNGGIRSTYYHLATYLTYQSIGKFSPFPVFSSGPHTKTTLNFHEQYTFGHYNPEFLRWAGVQLKHITGDKALVKETRGLVKTYLYPALIKYYRAYTVLQANPDDWKKLLLDYQNRIKERELPRHYYWDYLFDRNNLQKYPGLAKYMTETKVSPGILGMTVNFWLRRDIDGTQKEIFSILHSFLKAYQLI